MTDSKHQLTVVTARFNPLNYATPERHYRDFAAHMLDSGVRLVTVECAYGERPHTANVDPRIIHVPVRAKTWSFCKENLLNIGIARVPDAQYIAWIDSDVFFRRPDWAAATVDALHHYQVIQPWSDCYDLGPSGQHMQHHRSWCHQYHKKQPMGPTAWKSPYCFPHPGFAWAIRRDVLDWVGGLIDFAVMGSGDHHMAYAMLGKVDVTFPKGASQSYIESLRRWQSLATACVNGKIGYVEGTIEHRFHGAKKNRGYQDRWKMFVDHGYDPVVDIKRNTHGVVEWSGNKPALEHDFDLYLRSRNEDSNDWN